MIDWSGKRKEWTTARDKHEIKKGAVSSVSIGDSIDKVNKSIGKGYKPLLAALTALEKDLAKYRSSLAKTKPKKNFPGWIDSNISKEIDSLKKYIENDLKYLTLASDAATDSQCSTLSALPNVGNMPNYQKYMKTNQTATWAQATQAIGLFTVPLKLIPIIQKRGKEIGSIKWQAKLKGLEKNYATVESYGEKMSDDISFIAEWAKSPDYDNFLKMHQQSRQRTWSHDSNSEVKQAIANLIG